MTNQPAPNHGLAKIDIFRILGIQGNSPDHEALLSEFQDAIWEDTMNSEVTDNLTEADIAKVEAILENETLSDSQRQEQLYGLLMDKVPNIEEVLQNKTVQLKADMLMQRVEGLRQYWQSQGNAQSIATVDAAEKAMYDGDYATTLSLLEQVTVATH